MIVDGRALAGEALVRAKARAARLPHPPRVVAVVANETAATRSYLSIKAKSAADAGCVFKVHNVETAGIKNEVLSALIVDSVRNAAEGADAIVVQLPLPAWVDASAVCNSIPVEKDADVLSTVARMRFEANEPNALIPPVAKAVSEIFSAYGIDPAGKRAVVLGSGWLVGKPCATFLSHLGAGVFHPASGTDGLTGLMNVDIVVSGIGSPHAIKPTMLKEGTILIDAGMSESGGVVVGDADPACALKCSLFTPVPGGIGPLAVACLFENVVSLTQANLDGGK